MIHIYESEVLNKLMERDGINIPSSVPPYESEIKAYLINQVKLAYPKLTDYEAEWLLYNYTKHLPADFPVESITNVTEATVNNVVPYAYKSAILSGNTLVNVVGEKYKDCNLPTNQYVTVYGMDEAYKSDTYRIKQTDLKCPLTPNKEYLIIVDVQSMENCTTLMAYTYDGTNTEYNASLRAEKIGLNVARYTPTTAITRIAYYVTKNTEQKVIFGQPMVIEYQEGMEDWDIPYFEGMQSVKTPVLTTSNEDGTKTNILTVNEEVELRGVGEVRDELNLLTGELTQRIGEIVLDGSHNIVIGSDNIESYETMEFFIEDVYKNGMLNHKQISDKLPYDFSNDDYEHFYVTDERVIVFVKKSKLATQDTNGFKQYLSQNPLTVQYQLSTESIKTVDLIITDESGNKINYFMPIEGTMHIQTDGTPIKPTVSTEIPVEATTQNLASFINMEMEE